MMKEFCLMTGANESEIAHSWTKTQYQVLSYAKVEKKSAVKKLILRYREYKECGNVSKHMLKFILSI